MAREGHGSSSRSKKSRSRPDAVREYTLKLIPSEETVAPNGALRPTVELVSFLNSSAGTRSATSDSLVITPRMDYLFLCGANHPPCSVSIFKLTNHHRVAPAAVSSIGSGGSACWLSCHAGAVCHRCTAVREG